MSRRLLQLLTGLVALATVVLGTIQITFGVENPLYGGGIPAHPVLDSNLRFFAGLGLGLGLLFFWILPRIERHAVLFRVGWLCAFLGGVGRLISMPAVGLPPAPIVAITILEVAGAPLFVYWHSRVAADPRWAAGAHTADEGPPPQVRR